jgi:hypothetical protein
VLSGMDVTNMEGAMEASRRLGDRASATSSQKGGTCPDEDGG